MTSSRFPRGCDLDFSLLSSTLAVEGKHKLCMELALGCFDSFGRAEGIGCRQCLGNG